ncbi:MAG: CHRD domain-containing protein [Bryobacterales bacterium]|nr:CHRD domain-containing protein [Bryobacterales bacterium]
MMKTLLVLSALTASAWAQSAETAVFVAALSPANEVPAITNYEASGTAVLYAHAMRNAQGQIVSGSVDFVVFHNFPDTPTVTGLHVHNGAAGVNAGVVINTGIAGGANSLVLTSARGQIERQAQVLASDTAGVAALRGMFENPNGYYANLHTTAYPGGAIRGQLYRAERSVLIGRMRPQNEIPAITDFAGTATGSVEAIRAYAENYRYIGGATTFSVDYSVPEATTFTGLHIHTGNRTVNGGVLINTGIAAGANSVDSAASGSGNITRRVEVPAGTPAVGALEGLFDVPENYYINIHSTRYPGGVMRSQMQRTETVRMPFSMSPANEVPAITGLDATAVGNVWISALRDQAGAVTAASFTFDVNTRFPGETRFTGLHIHDGKAGANGGVTINSGLTATDSATGFGNFWRSVNISGGQALASLNSLLTNPENHYINLHTAVNAGGAVRAQMGVENTRTPVITEVISAVSDVNVRNVAPAGQFTIFGSDLVKVGSNLGGLEGLVLPSAVNGTSVTIGGIAAPIVAVGVEPRNNPSTYIVAQVPVDAPAGQHPVVVKTANGTSSPRQVTVAAQAPALFFNADGAIVIRVAAFELVTAAAPARAGEALAIISTGLGQTTPALATGEIPQAANPVTQAVSLTVGGQNATVTGSTTIPGFPGFYLTLFQMPANVAPGSAPVVLRINSLASNTVMLSAR